MLSPQKAEAMRSRLQLDGAALVLCVLYAASALLRPPALSAGPAAPSGHGQLTKQGGPGAGCRAATMVCCAAEPTQRARSCLRLPATAHGQRRACASPVLGVGREFPQGATRVRASLAGVGSVLVVGDSTARRVYEALWSALASPADGERVEQRVNKRHGDHSASYTPPGAAARPLQLRFLWRPFAANVTAALHPFGRGAAWPEVLIISIGLWDMLHVRSAAAYRGALAQLGRSLAAPGTHLPHHPLTALRRPALLALPAPLRASARVWPRTGWRARARS